MTRVLSGWNIVRLDDEHIIGVCRLWNKEIGSQFPMRERLLRQNGSKHSALLREGSLIVCDDNAKIIGAVISKRMATDISTGYISMLLVDSEYRGRGIGSRLLYLAEQTLIRYGVRLILVGADPGHFLPGIPADDEMTKTWLGQKGYIHTGTTHDLLGDFRVGWDGDSPERKGVTFSTVDGKDHAPLLAFLGRSFPGRWEQSTRDYFAAGGTGREFVIAIKDDGEIIGFCRVNDEQAPVLAANQFWSPYFNEPSAGIGPLGIAEAYRSSGYGRALLQASIHVLFERGIRLIVIDWTSAVTFYEKLGFRVWKSYDLYIRQV